MSENEKQNVTPYSERLDEMIEQSKGIVENRFYTVQEAADLVSMSKSTINRHIYDHETLVAHHPKGGNAVRIKGKDLIAWMEGDDEDE